MAWTTTELLAAVRRSGYLPDASDLTDADLLAFGDEELADRFTELLKTAREEYRVKVTDISIQPGTRRYYLPRRALAGAVRSIVYVDADGTEMPALEVPAQEAWRFAGERHYCFEGDEIVLVASPSTSGAKLRVRYVARLPRLITIDEGARIYKGQSGGVELFDPPNNLRVGTTLVDIVSGDSPFPTLYADLIVAAWNDPILTFTTPVEAATASQTPAGGKVAYSYMPSERVDYLVPRDTTVYPPIPQELHGRLALAIEARALYALADPRAPLVEARLERAMSRAVNTIEPRNQDRKPAIINHGSRLRQGRRSFRYGWSG